MNGDDFAVWGQWKVAKAIGMERDVTEEVESFLPAPTPPAPPSVSASGVQTIVGSALRDMNRHRLLSVLWASSRVGKPRETCAPSLCGTSGGASFNSASGNSLSSSPTEDSSCQASPLSFVLDEDARYQILKRFRSEPK
jgi:hypothetical protein